MSTHSERGLISMTSDRAFDVWYPARKPAHHSATRHDLHDFAVETIGSNTPIRFLEFGVHSGNSISRFASKFTNPDSEFYGFDSFIGLPEDWAGKEAGFFSTQGNKPHIDDRRVELIAGWFQNSAIEFMPGLSALPDKVTLIHYDADLYSSTLFLLSSLWWHLPSYYFIFDEFIGEEIAALRNFLAAFPADVEFMTRTDDDRGKPVQIFGKLSRTKMLIEGIG